MEPNQIVVLTLMILSNTEFYHLDKSKNLKPPTPLELLSELYLLIKHFTLRNFLYLG